MGKGGKGYRPREIRQGKEEEEPPRFIELLVFWRPAVLYSGIRGSLCYFVRR
jgi:hypothetical protein